MVLLFHLPPILYDPAVLSVSDPAASAMSLLSFAIIVRSHSPSILLKIRSVNAPVLGSFVGAWQIQIFIRECAAEEEVSIYCWRVNYTLICFPFK